MPAAAVGKSPPPPPSPPLGAVATATLWVGLLMWVGWRQPWHLSKHCPETQRALSHCRTMQSQCTAAPPVIQQWCKSVSFLALCPCECLQAAHEGGDGPEVTQSVPSKMTWGASWTTITLKQSGNLIMEFLFSLVIAFIYLIVQYCFGGLQYFFI